MNSFVEVWKMLNIDSFNELLKNISNRRTDFK